jgi:hypothetical protein
MSGSTATLHFPSSSTPSASTFPFCCSSWMCLFFFTATLRTRWWTRPYRKMLQLVCLAVCFRCHPTLTINMLVIATNSDWIHCLDSCCVHIKAAKRWFINSSMWY